MAASSIYVFYDTETTGPEAPHDQIVQFAVTPVTMRTEIG